MVFVCLTSITWSQERKFDFGLSTQLNLSQIEGDNLRGFRKIGPGFSLLGGYKINSKNRLHLSLHLDKIGSEKGSESISPFSSNLLISLDYWKYSIYLGYDVKFHEDWEGNFRWGLLSGLKLNSISSFDINVTARSNLINSISEDDILKRYLSLNIQPYYNLSKHTNIFLSYEHSLKSILKSSEESSATKLVPFGLALGITYFINV